MAGPQDGAGGSVVDREIARRQQAVDAAKLAIIEGDELALEAHYPEALALYLRAYQTTSDAAISRAVHELARTRFASISVVYARELAQAARYDDANRVLDQVLAADVAPQFDPALRLKRELADPERYNPALTPEHLAKVERVTELFEVADGHMRLGNWDMASLTYASILREDPTNEAARRGMEAASLRISDYHRTSRDHFRAKALSAVDEAWEFQVPLRGDTIEQIKALPGGGLADEITRRLNTIILPQIEFTEEPLRGVAEFLTQKSKELDPTGVGVNFVVQIPPEDAQLRDISVNLILNSVPLGEVVRFVTEATDTKFYVDQFAVVITSRSSASQAIVTRTFYVPPDWLNSNPDEAGADPAANDPFGGGGGANRGGLRIVKMDAKTFLERSGVQFPDGASAVYTPVTNTLIVRNTQANIDLVDAIVSRLNKNVQRIVRVALTQVELNVVEDDELTFDTLLGQFNLPGSQGVFGGAAGLATSSGAAGEAGALFPFIHPGTDTPVGNRSLSGGIRSGDESISGSALESLVGGAQAGSAVAGGPTRKSPSQFAVSGVFTDPQFQLAMRAIAQKKNSTVTNQPATLTRPGLRSVIEVHREFIYPTEYDPPEIPQTFQQARNDLIFFDPINNLITLIPGQDPPNTFPVTPAHPTAFDFKNVGTRFEVEPTIDADGFYVTLNMAVEFSQFEGFINYGTPITNGTTVLTDNRILQPLFKISRFNTPVTVQDGANFVIGGLMNEEVEFTEDKTPFLGDVPVVGRLFKGDVSERRRKAILFFVNVRILDPSGQPVNRELAPE